MSHCCCWDLFNLIKISFSTLFITFYVFCLSIFHFFFSFPGDMEFFLSIYVKQFCNFCYYKTSMSAETQAFYVSLYLYPIYICDEISSMHWLPILFLLSIIYLMFVFLSISILFSSSCCFWDEMIKLGVNRATTNKLERIW